MAICLQAEVRYGAATSLGQVGQVGQAMLTIRREQLQRDDSWARRRDAGRFLGQMGLGDEATIVALWRGLLDRNNDVRTACAQAMALMGRRFPEKAEAIMAKLVLALSEPEFDQPDDIKKRTGHDYAFDALWLLVTGGALN